ncbi:MAG: hypothetical protein GAK43_01955 [Stenotrophomonas maltophilia]|nr:MAG: hypothetical protein GAK43_01955 [Stenotrophomonas maltophilia]
MRALLPLFASASLIAPVQAAWYLDAESSRLGFVATHDAGQAGNQRFLVLHGSVDEQGQATLRIEMDSVSSGTPLLDERLSELLFDTRRYPEAQVQTRLDLGPILGLADGAQLEMRLPLRLTLREVTRTYHADLLVTRLDARRFQAVTLSPLLLDAVDLGLAPGLEQLRTLAGLRDIGPSVPVGAVLIFAQR